MIIAWAPCITGGPRGRSWPGLSEQLHPLHRPLIHNAMLLHNALIHNVMVLYNVMVLHNAMVFNAMVYKALIHNAIMLHNAMVFSVHWFTVQGV